MNRNFILREWRGWLCGLAVVVLSGCIDEELPGSEVALKDGEISLQWVAANMGRVVTKGTDVKNGDERRINNVHVFLFGPDGKYLEPGNSGNDAFQGYRYLASGSTNWVLQTDMFADQTETGAKNATVYVLANMPEGTFTGTSDDGKPDELANGKTPMEALEAMTIAFPDGEFTAQMPETGLPMVIKREGVDLSNTAANKIVALQLRSMMSRIDLNFTMVPLESDGNLPSLEFSKVSVSNFPKGGKVVSQLVNWDGSTTEKAEETVGMELNTAEEGTLKGGLTGQVLRSGHPQSMTLYMFEHARLAEDNDDYPMDEDEDSDYYKQRYKNKRAKQDAAYIELEGVYTSHNSFSYKVIYRLYVGANPVDNFTIMPNCQYKNNITVTGITVNNYGDEALLDTRVTIDKSTPAFIEILRERRHDAHFNVTPMDVYFNHENASVTIEILDENGTDLAAANEMTWIRMESYHQAYEAANENLYDFGEYLDIPKDKDVNNQYSARFAGDGKRKYFTTGLLDELEYSYGESSRKVTMNASDGEEQRVYFYIDENVPTGNSLPERVADRSATIRVTYYENGEEVSSKTALIRQAGMRRVYFNKYSSGGGEYAKVGRTAYYFYIEEYEEYLAHYDPKNEYTQTYEGLEWGLDGLETGLGVEGEFYQYLSWGWYNTAKIMAEYRNQRGSWRGHEMTLNELPSGAAEYCYNKNKRKDGVNGTLTDENVRWFLPTISELEYALETHYGNYDVFQDKWYWSSNPGATWNPSGGGDVGENKDYARATRVKYDPDNKVDKPNEFGYVHYRSNPDYIYTEDGSVYEGEDGKAKGYGGYAERSVKFRIRAVYIPERQVPNDWELRNRYNSNGSVN